MDCEHTREHLSAFLDEELDAEAYRQVAVHLETCEACRAQQAELQSVHAALTKALRTERMAAERVKARVLEWRPPSAALKGRPWIRALSYVLAIAAGFLLALFVRPAVEVPPSSALPDTPRVVPDTPAPVQIVLATGPLKIKTPDTADWDTVPLNLLPSFQCPADATLRTEDAALCELSTSRGGRIRMNQQTEITIRSASEVELLTGDVWCAAPADEPFRVATASPAPAAVFSCTPSSQGVAAAPLEGQLRVMSAAGTVQVRTGDDIRQLEAGAVCTIAPHEATVRQSPEELLLATRWMQPLLVLQGAGHPDLSLRVDKLVALLGRAKISFLAEADLRGLGEHGALPLLRFVADADPEQERERRRAAMRILADTAPIWLTPELITRLEDIDPEVRVSAARALTRLTNQSAGTEADDWREESPKCWPAIVAWRDWWTSHSITCAPPPTGVEVRPLPSTEGPFLQKARN